MKETLERIWELISRMSVSGDNVDTVAVIRAELRRAYKMLDEKKEKKNDGTA